MRETKVQEGRQCISSHIVTMWLSQDSNPSSLPAKTCSELPTKPIPWHQQECTWHSDTSWKVILKTIQLLKYLFFFFCDRVEIGSLRDNTPQIFKLCNETQSAEWTLANNIYPSDVGPVCFEFWMCRASCLKHNLQRISLLFGFLPKESLPGIETR